jgi:hypothetical protein
MKKIIASLIVSSVPLISLAQSTTIETLIEKLSGIVKSLMPILVGIAVVYFIWKVIQYTMAGDEGKKEEAKLGIFWGIIGLFVIISVWGLVYFLQDSLGIYEGTGVKVPVFPTY